MNPGEVFCFVGQDLMVTRGARPVNGKRVLGRPLNPLATGLAAA